MSRQAVAFDCHGAALCGIVETPGYQPADTGILIVTGGPQYRVGSHRQFVEFAAAVSVAGYACMRFDHRGMGDSDGEPQPFDELDDDIRAAIDGFFEAVPGLRRVVLWGLCDAASAAIMYAHSDARVQGLVLVNPWVRRAQTEARTQLDHYYRARLLDREFWARLLRGEVRILNSIRELLRNIVKARGAAQSEPADFVDRMLDGARQYAGPVLLILSGQDLTAQEFSGLAGSPGWQEWFRREHLDRIELPEANHTFSRRDWKERVASATLDWLGEHRHLRR